MTEYEDFSDFEDSIPETYEKPEYEPVVTPQVEPKYEQSSYQKKYKKKPRNLKPIITIIGIVAIVACLIGVIFLLPTNNSNIISEKYVEIMNTGPKASVQSLANGNTLVVPELGFTGVYGYYISNSKMGEISFSSQGLEIYDEEMCIKVIGSGNFESEISGQNMDLNYNYEAYIAYDDNNLKYMNFKMNYQEYEIDLQMTSNEETGEITSSYTFEGFDGIDTTTVMKMSEEYWEITDAFEYFYEGYEKEYSYTSESFGYETETTIKLIVTGKEDVVVPAGKFENCYILETGTGSGNDFSSSTVSWVNDEGIVPKIEVKTSTMGIGDLPVTTLKLEEYYEN